MESFAIKMFKKVHYVFGNISSNFVKENLHSQIIYDFDDFNHQIQKEYHERFVDKYERIKKNTPFVNETTGTISVHKTTTSDFIRKSDRMFALQPLDMAYITMNIPEKKISVGDEFFYLDNKGKPIEFTSILKRYQEINLMISEYITYYPEEKLYLLDITKIPFSNIELILSHGMKICVPFNPTILDERTKEKIRVAKLFRYHSLRARKERLGFKTYYDIWHFLSIDEDHDDYLINHKMYDIETICFDEELRSEDFITFRLHDNKEFINEWRLNENKYIMLKYHKNHIELSFNVKYYNVLYLSLFKNKQFMIELFKNDRSFTPIILINVI